MKASDTACVCERGSGNFAEAAAESCTHVTVLVVVVVLEEVPNDPPGFALLLERPAEYDGMEEAPEKRVDEEEDKASTGSK